MTVRAFLGTDPGIPNASGLAGSLISVLDAVLINGFNSQSVVSITRSGSTATVNAPGHGLHSGSTQRDFWATIAGADQAEYNGSFKITYIDADNFSYQVTGTPATPATGAAITAKASPVAGWTKPFVSGFVSVYRAGSGNRHYFRFDDSAAQYTRLVGYESMSDVNTGLNAFPTAAQSSGGIYVGKSNAANSTERFHFIIASETFVFMAIDQDSTLQSCVPFCFGEINSYKGGDAYHSVVIGAQSTTVPSGNQFYSGQNNLTGTSAAHYFARSYTQTGGSVTMGKLHDGYKTGNSSFGTAGQVYPSPVDGGMWISPIWLTEPSLAVIRGHLPGVWSPLHNKPLNSGDSYDGSGPTAGKSFFVVGIYTGAQIHLESSNTW